MTTKKEMVKVETGLLEFTDEKVKLIKDTIAKDATDTELQLFLHQAGRAGLDPLSRQIYFLKHVDKRTGESRVMIQTSIDGFRLVAERSGVYAGQDEPEFTEDNGLPVCAKVRVYKWRDDVRYQAAVGVAYFSEYKPADGKDYMWRKMPHTMLAKVAEALALRKAFPQDLSGLYTAEEMDQANIEPQEAKVVIEEPKAEDWVLAEIIRKGGEMGLTEEKTKEYSAKKFGKTDFETLTGGEASNVLDAINAKLAEQPKKATKAFDQEPAGAKIEAAHKELGGQLIEGKKI